MPIYQRPVQPFFLEPTTLGLASAFTGPSVGGQVVLTGYELTASVTVTSMRTAFSAVGGTPGTCQMGIYDASAAGRLPGSLLANTATFTASSGSTLTKNLLSNLPLSPGLYWLALLDTSSGDTVFGFGGQAFFYTSVTSNTTGLTTLPGTIGAVSDFNVAIAFCGLILGGWS